jgi:hypothetical protein
MVKEKFGDQAITTTIKPAKNLSNETICDVLKEKFGEDAIEINEAINLTFLKEEQSAFDMLELTESACLKVTKVK